MVGFLDRLNQGFATTGRPDLVHSQAGFLDGLMRMQPQQPMQLTQPGQAPTEARVGTARAPGQGGGFLNNLHNSISDNRGMLMGLGTGLLADGWAGAANAMPGMQYDEARRSQAAEQERAERQSGAQRQLGQQHGIDPLVFDAGMGGEALSRAMAPQAQPEPIRLGQSDILVDPVTGQQIAQGRGPASQAPDMRQVDSRYQSIDHQSATMLENLDAAIAASRGG